jgi:hypothetical protein
MPRKSRGVRARLAAEVPLELGQRIEALRRPYDEWLTKALFVEKALEYYVDAAERMGIEQLPPFKPVKPRGTDTSSPGSGPMGHVAARDKQPAKAWMQQPEHGVSHSLSIPVNQWQDLLRTG